MSLSISTSTSMSMSVSVSVSVYVSISMSFKRTFYIYQLVTKNIKLIKLYKLLVLFRHKASFLKRGGGGIDPIPKNLTCKNKNQLPKIGKIWKGEGGGGGGGVVYLHSMQNVCKLFFFHYIFHCQNFIVRNILQFVGFDFNNGQRKVRFFSLDFAYDI